MQSSEAATGSRLPQTVKPRGREDRDSKVREAAVQHPRPLSSCHRSSDDDATAVSVDSFRSRSTRGHWDRRQRRNYVVKPQSSHHKSEILTNSESGPSNPVEKVDDKGSVLAVNQEPREQKRELRSCEVDAEVAEQCLRLAELQMREEELRLDEEQLSFNDQQQEDEVFFHHTQNTFHEINYRSRELLVTLPEGHGVLLSEFLSWAASSCSNNEIALFFICFKRAVTLRNVLF